jgi:hypothetical protein
MIVRDTKTGRRYEVLGLGRRPGTLRLLDLEKREVWYNAGAQFYEPVGSIEDVPLPEDEMLGGNPDHVHHDATVPTDELPAIVAEALASETVQRRYARRNMETVVEQVQPEALERWEPEDSEF